VTHNTNQLVVTGYTCLNNFLLYTVVYSNNHLCLLWQVPWKSEMNLPEPYLVGNEPHAGNWLWLILNDT